VLDRLLAGRGMNVGEVPLGEWVAGAPPPGPRKSEGRRPAVAAKGRIEGSAVIIAGGGALLASSAGGKPTLSTGEGCGGARPPAYEERSTGDPQRIIKLSGDCVLTRLKSMSSGSGLCREPATGGRESEEGEGVRI